MPGFRKKAGRKFLLQQHMAAGERIERGGTKRIAELFHVKHRRGNVCVNVSRETLGIVARCAGDTPLSQAVESFLPHFNCFEKQRNFSCARCAGDAPLSQAVESFCPLHGRELRLHPTFLFSREKYTFSAAPSSFSRAEKKKSALRV